MLKSIGFSVKRVSARVYDPTNGFGAEYDHLAIIARFDQEEYLTDVGFGEFVFHPLKIELNEVQLDERGEFRIESYDDTYLQVSQKADQEWSPVYIFSMIERQFKEYEGMCRYHQTSLESHFTQKRMCSIPNEGGRVTLTRDRIKIKNESEVREIPINDEEEFHRYLWDYFKVRIL